MTRARDANPTLHATLSEFQRRVLQMDALRDAPRELHEIRRAFNLLRSTAAAPTAHGDEGAQSEQRRGVDRVVAATPDAARATAATGDVVAARAR